MNLDHKLTGWPSYGNKLEEEFMFCFVLFSIFTELMLRKASFLVWVSCKKGDVLFLSTLIASNPLSSDSRVNTTVWKHVGGPVRWLRS